jgi:hypothetical protein
MRILKDPIYLNEPIVVDKKINIEKLVENLEKKRLNRFKNE